jgi:hypothetical protein
VRRSKSADVRTGVRICMGCNIGFVRRVRQRVVQRRSVGVSQRVSAGRRGGIGVRSLVRFDARFGQGFGRWPVMRRSSMNKRVTDGRGVRIRTRSSVRGRVRVPSKVPGHGTMLLLPISVEVCSFDMVDGGDHRARHGSTADRISDVSIRLSTPSGSPTTMRRWGLLPRAR